MLWAKMLWVFKVQYKIKIMLLFFYLFFFLLFFLGYKLLKAPIFTSRTLSNSIAEVVTIATVPYLGIIIIGWNIDMFNI